MEKPAGHSRKGEQNVQRHRRVGVQCACRVGTTGKSFRTASYRMDGRGVSWRILEFQPKGYDR